MLEGTVIEHQWVLTFVAEERSSHWNARLMLANANKPSGARSCSRLLKFSLTIHLEMNEELLFAMLFLGLALFAAFLETGARRLELPAPNAGADPTESGPALPLIDCLPSLELGGTSADVLPSSFMLENSPFDLPLRFVSVLNRAGGARRELSDKSDSFVPIVAG